jgi:hypothetical protein
MSPVALTADQQRIVQAIYEVFREDGRWPIVDAIDRLADERWQLDAYAVLASLPSSVALVDRRHLREDQEVKLRVRAIAGCEGAEADLELFVRAVRWLAEKERSFRPTSMHAAEQVRVTSEQLATDFAGEGTHLDSVASAKICSLADIERLGWGGSYAIDGDPGRWEIYLRRDIRPFRRVETLSDYLAIRDRLDGTTGQEPPPATGLPAVLGVEQPHEQSTPVDARRYVFIAMPFGAAWSADVQDCIEQACERVHAEGVALRWERADEIDRPGRITEQVLDALAAADVIIADITELNANVVYEVGYADASDTPLILLNQDPGASPFDLKDQRQIKYSPNALDVARGVLARRLRAALAGQVEVPAQTPGDQCRDFGVPRTREQVDRVRRERPIVWEYRLFAGSLNVGLQELDFKWRDYELGITDHHPVDVSSEEFLEYLDAALSRIRGILDPFGRPFDPEIQERAFGPPGEPGEPGGIEYFSRRILIAYEAMLVWVAEVRAVRAQPPFEGLLELAHRYADGPIRQIRTFVHTVSEEVDRALEAVVSKDVDSPPLELLIELNLRLAIDPDVLADSNREFERLVSG